MKAISMKVIKRRLVMMALIVVAVVVWAGGVVWVNTHVVRYPTEWYAMGESVHLDGAFQDNYYSERTEGYSVIVSEAEIMTPQEYLDRFAVHGQWTASSYRDIQSLVVLKMTIENASNSSEGYVDLIGLTLAAQNCQAVYQVDTELWSNGEKNVEPQQVGVSVRPHTTYTTYVPFSASIADAEGPYDIAVVDNDFDLHLSSGPVRNMVRITVVP